MTPAPIASAWTEHTLEQEFIQAQLIERGIDIVTGHNIAKIEAGGIEAQEVYSGRAREIECASLVLITARLPVDGIYYDLKGAPDRLAEAGIKSVKRVGDCNGPGIIAAAVWSGHRYARELDGPPPGDVPFKRELVRV